jgi:iron complex outermembrane recepter protein
VMDDYKPFVSIGASYTGSMFNEPATYLSGAGVTIPTTTLLRSKQPAYTTVDASIGITRDGWSAEIYGSNLTNSHASTFTSSAQFIKSEVPIRPRVIALKIGYNF